MRLSLVAIHIKESTRAVPLGPAMLASALKKHLADAVETDVIDLYLEQSVAECLRRILADKPDYVGFSMYMWNREKILAIAAELKRRKPSIVVFAGGPEAGADSDSIRHYKCIDFILKGEGEDLTVSTFKSLLDGTLRPGSIGVAAPCTPDLATLPSPFLDGTLDPAAYPGLLWELSRGCLFKCDFCYESRGNHGVRRFPMERIREELKVFSRHSNIEQIFILDPTFNCDPQRAKEILRFIKKTAPDIHYFIEIRSEFIDAEMARLFASISCSLQIGMQSAHPAVLKNVNRNINRKDFAKKVQLLNRAQVTYGFDLIIGLPGDTLEGFRSSFDFTMSMEPNHLDIFVLSVLPGTPLCTNAAAFGLEYMPENPYRVLSTPHFSSADIEKANRLSEAFDLFYNTGKAVPWYAMIAAPLGMRHCEFFEEFSAWLNSGGADRNGDIIDLQRRFLEFIFRKRLNNAAFASIASDIAAYFGHTARIREDCDDFVDKSITATYVLNPLSSFAEFAHNPVELVQHIFSGMGALSDLERLLGAKPYSTLLFMNSTGEMDIRFLSEDKLEFLQQVRSGIDRLPQDVTLKRFARACIADGIILDRGAKSRP